MNSPSCGDVSYAVPPSKKAKASEDQQPISDSMTLDGLRQQLKAKKLPTSGNKKTLAARLSTHLDSSGASNRAKQTDRNPRLSEARQRAMQNQPQSPYIPLSRTQNHSAQEAAACSARSQSHSPISTRRPSEGSKGRQRDPLRFSPLSPHSYSACQLSDQFLRHRTLR